MLETFVFHKVGKNYGAGTYSYNRDSVFVVASSLFLFLTFLKTNIISSNIINTIESSSFFVYIISENENIWKSPDSMYDVLNASGWEHSHWYLFLVVGFSILVFIGCILIDKIRYFFFHKFENKIGKFADDFESKLI